MTGQRGQALISVLVIMTVIFIAAGVIALGTSTLVLSERQPDKVVANDLTVQSAVAAAIGSRSTRCRIAPSADNNSGNMTFATTPTSMVLPNGSSSATANSYCLGLSSTPSKPTPLTARSAGPNCWVATLPPTPLAQGQHWWILFNVTWPAGSFYGTVDVTTNSAPAGKCPALLSPSPCEFGPAGVIYGTAQAAIDCELETTSVPGGATVVVQGVHPSAMLFGQGGDMAGTPTYFILREHLPSSVQPHDEEALVSTGSGGVTLLYEAQLP